jgi:adenylosuccinate lyase
MAKVWSEENKWSALKKVELAVATAQAKAGLIPKKAAEQINKKAKFSIDRIKEIEATTKHDVIAFVSNLAEHVGDAGKYIHYGLTSSDVIDTGIAVQIAESKPVLLKAVGELEKTLAAMAKKHYQTLCVGRTHGIHAEPTTFGFKMAGFLAELRRNHERLKVAFEGVRFGQISGAVGTYSFLMPTIEKDVCKELKLKTETIATQVIPRDRHAALMQALSLTASFMERLSVELRHLQRTEVSEVIEGFTPGQKGSSAMPHKKNPISAENLTGVARLVRSYSIATEQNVALWHERDISHSSVERVAIPDAFIILHYGLERLNKVLKNLYVDEERMMKNLNSLGGQIYSSHILLDLVDAGVKRETAYTWVQGAAHSLKDGESYRDAIMEHKEISKKLKKKDLEDLFSGKRHVRNIKKVINRVLTTTEKIK